MSDAKHKHFGSKNPNRIASDVTPAVALPNSLRLKAPNSANNRQNMSSILQRLPFIQQINTKQNTMVKFQPTWLAWCAQTQKRHGSLALNLSEHALLSSVKQGIIHISCDNTGVASLIKHQQTKLLDAFHASGFDDISQIKVSMSLTQPSKIKPTKQKQNKPKQTPESCGSAIKSIEATQSSIENEQLAASLERLAATLKSSES